MNSSKPGQDSWLGSSRWQSQGKPDPATHYSALISATSCTTAGPDGFTDLVLHFDDQAVSAALGPVTDGQVFILTLTGKLLPRFGGAVIRGQDVVIVINK